MIEAPGSLAGGDFAFPAMSTRIERRNAPVGRFSLLDEMIVERGTKDDWELLHELHYKAENLPIGPRFWKLSLEGRTIGIVVTSNPKGLLKERHLLFPQIAITGQDTRIVNTHRYKWVNNHFRCVSRFVLDTMYRGIGAGYRTMNLVARMEGNTYMEIQSSMSKFNLFGQKAGFRFVRPSNSSKFELGLKFFRQHFDANPQDFEALVAEVEAKSAGEQAIILEACKTFYGNNSALEKTGRNRANGPRRIEALSLRGTIRQIQQLALASPMYGIWKNPEPGVAVPLRLPLTAFDAQAPDACFRGS